MEMGMGYHMPHSKGMSARGWTVFQTTPLPTPIWESLVGVNSVIKRSIPFQCVGWAMRTCWSRSMFLNSGCHLNAHLGSCEKILIPRPHSSSPELESHKMFFKLSGDLNEQKLRITGLEPLEYTKKLNTLTVKPSLFLPPSVYRLPSLGSGRKAGLEMKQ